MRDRNYRIEVAEDGVHVYNKALHVTHDDAFDFYPELGVETDGGHAFYSAPKLARAEIAFRLGKRYAQDNPIDWGVSADKRTEDLTRLQEAGHTLCAARTRRRGLMPFILETIVATKNADGSFHVRPYGLHRADDGWIFLPFRPLAGDREPRPASLLTVSAPSDVRVIAGFLTGRDSGRWVPPTSSTAVRLADTAGHMELEAVSFEDDPVRPRFCCKVLHEAAHRPFLGFNRAQAAVAGGGDPLHPPRPASAGEGDGEIAYLQTAVEKCAGTGGGGGLGWI